MMLAEHESFRTALPAFPARSSGIAVVAIMTFLPWVYFIDSPHKSAQILGLPFVIGIVAALTLVPKKWDWIMIAIAFVVLSIVPTNILGHALAHAFQLGCYD